MKYRPTRKDIEDIIEMYKPTKPAGVPSFVHAYPPHWQHGCDCALAHSRPGAVHLRIDLILDRMQGRWMWIIREHPELKRALRAFISLSWGLNCNFPIIDVIKFTIWEYRGCPDLDS